MTMLKDKFQHRNQFTIGVEEEYMLCDPITGELVNRANQIINSLSSNILDRYSYELLLSEIEINTSVCKTVADAIKEVIFLRNNTRLLGEKLDFKIGISGTHPTSLCKDQKFVTNDSYNWVSDQLGYYAKRNVTFATHVHISVNDKECAIQVANSLRRWIAPLLALSTNSPFFEGELTGLKSSRIFQFGVFPRTNIPIYFKNYDDYIKIVKNYIKSKTIEKPRQIWWKIRPHLDYGTIEFRICDAQRSLLNLEMIVALSQALVYQAVDDYVNGKLITDFNLEFLNDALWKAARFPFGVNIIDPVDEKISTIYKQINLMLGYVENALLYFNNQHIQSRVMHILENGTEADDLIKIYNNDNFIGLKKYLIENVEYNLD